MAQITITNAKVAFDCPANDTILRAALRQGLGFPYECNVGSCGTCRFELVEGEVVHERVDAPGWTEADRRRKRYLGCQSHALSDCTVKVRLADHYKSRYLPQQTIGRLFAVLDHTHDIREFRFRLEKPTRFLPGQYALLYVPGVTGARAYSMCNVTATGEEWHFQIKKVPTGTASVRLFDKVELGEAIDMDGPFGMAYLREEAPRDILCLAGGSGLSPMISITRAAVASPALAGRQIHFVYGGRAARDIAGEPMLKELPGFGERLHYYPAISAPDSDSEGLWTGRIGFVPDIARALFGERMKEMEIYFAGPPAMADAVIRMLVDVKVPMTQVHYDQFF